MIRILVWFFIGVGAAVAATLHFAVSQLPPTVVRAYGAASVCGLGLYGVVVVYNDGSSKLFNGQNPVPPEIEAYIIENNLLISFPVPCEFPIFNPHTQPQRRESGPPPTIA